MQPHVPGGVVVRKSRKFRDSVLAACAASLDNEPSVYILRSTHPSVCILFAWDLYP